MNMTLDQHSIQLTCPKCGKQLKEQIGRLKRNRYVTCPACGRVAVNTDQLRRIEGSIDKELAELSKTFTFKL